MDFDKTALKWLLFVGVIGCSCKLTAAPWIDPGDEQLRHHIQYLADTGLIKSPITTWPIMWGAIAADLESASTASITDAQQWSLAFVRFHLQQASSSLNLHAYAGATGDPVVFRDFGSEQREENELSGDVDWVGEHLAARLKFTWVPNATDEKEYRYDGSYVAGLVGNWAVSVGAIDRWWGPSWKSGLILSSSARPVTAISLSRQRSTAFETPWLSWIGPWTFTAFAGQLEANRAVPNAKLLGARLALKPFSRFELGFTRTAQWGGEDRPQSFSTFWDMVLGNDNTGDNGIERDTNEPGNQLGAIDWRWSLPIESVSTSLYMQYVGEDESNGFPTRGIHLVGFEGAFSGGAIFNHFAIEYSDTMANAHTDPIPNLTYEHGIYRSGYRYYSRPIGSTFDNDTRSISLLVDHYFTDGSQLSWRVDKLDLNRDMSKRRNQWGGSVFEADDTTFFTQINYAFIIKNVKISTAVYNVSQEIRWNNQTIQGTGAGLAIEYKSD